MNERASGQRAAAVDAVVEAQGVGVCAAAKGAASTIAAASPVERARDVTTERPTGA